jgi:hypothetical protein
VILVIDRDPAGVPSGCLCSYWLERLREAEAKLEQARSPKVREAYRCLADHYASLRANCRRGCGCAPRRKC